MAGKASAWADGWRNADAVIRMRRAHQAAGAINITARTIRRR